MKVYAEQKTNTIIVGVEMTRDIINDEYAYMGEITSYLIEAKTELFTVHNPEFYADYIERWFEADAECRIDEPEDDWDVQDFLEAVRNHVFFEGNTYGVSLDIDVEITD